MTDAVSQSITYLVFMFCSRISLKLKESAFSCVNQCLIKKYLVKQLSVHWANEFLFCWRLNMEDILEIFRWSVWREHGMCVLTCAGQHSPAPHWLEMLVRRFWLNFHQLHLSHHTTDTITSSSLHTICCNN